MPAAVLTPLRGDFFCLPFGGNGAAFQGEQHPPHGETASAEWSLESDAPLADGTARLALTLETKVRPGRVTKQIFLKPGQPVVYQRHLIKGFAGPAPLGHHATLAMPDEEGVFAISTSPFRLGMTNPGVFSDPANGEYQQLAIGETFTDLARVPSLFKEPAEVDCSRLPARRGYTDLLIVVADADALAGRPAWTAAVNTRDHWVWFSLRNPAVLPTTAFWIENRGRHSFLWNGRNQCLGLLHLDQRQVVITGRLVIRRHDLGFIDPRMHVSQRVLGPVVLPVAELSAAEPRLWILALLPSMCQAARPQ